MLCQRFSAKRAIVQTWYANTVSYDFFSSQLTSTVILRLTCAVGQMTSMTIMTGSTTGAVLLRLVRAPQQITPKEKTVGIEA